MKEIYTIEIMYVICIFFCFIINDLDLDPAQCPTK